MHEPGNENERVWSDGSMIKYTNWGDGQPNNSTNNHDCVRINRNGGEWFDLTCWHILRYVCELDATLEMPTNSTAATVVSQPSAAATTQMMQSTSVTVKQRLTQTIHATQSTVSTTGASSTTIEGSTQLPTRTSTFVSVKNGYTSVTTTVSRPNTVKVNTQLFPRTSTRASSREAAKSTTRMSATPTARSDDALSTPMRSTILSVLPRDSTKATITKPAFTSQIHKTQISSSSNSRQATATSREAMTLVTTDLVTIAHETKLSSPNHAIYAAVAAAIGVLVLIVSLISVFIVWRKKGAEKSDAKTELTATFPNRRHNKSNIYCNGKILKWLRFDRKKKEDLHSMDAETSDDLQVNPLYCEIALQQHQMTENLSTTASQKDSRAEKMNILYESADRLERTAARESENVIYNT
ncbi:uncharacterized protein LOC134179744 isoform X2 [Corticium candelabrum]|uniref:uncharacterized protein LOC134179744 isoform X2 n=1 Tax=Corticium candelabrum TaxID=121492 RepID=UPI002E254E2B|nr:uncharacterized protein LOC134179744 isoform X2 [Corticium candelabrum]